MNKEFVINMLISMICSILLGFTLSSFTDVHSDSILVISCVSIYGILIMLKVYFPEKQEGG